MICCDRCQEWFHGDCVGISEKRGRLMENNGEDYICPNCSPCASPVPFQIVQTTLPTAGMCSSSESLMSPSPCEDRPSEDEGIKGKIRKASSEGAKKKFKIFQPVKLLIFSWCFLLIMSPARGYSQWLVKEMKSCVLFLNIIVSSKQIFFPNVITL